MGDLLPLSTAPAAAEAPRRAAPCDEACGVFHTVRRARGWAERSSPGRGGSPSWTRARAAAEIRRLRERHPAGEVVALADFTRCPPADAFSLALLGVREIICTAQADAPAAWRPRWART